MNKYPTAETAEALAIENALGHHFKDRSLLDRALTHASVTGGNEHIRDLERLEFLGDRVLGLMVAEALWRRFPQLAEGELAPRLNAMVRKETCADAARHWNVGPALRLSTGEDRQGGRQKNAILGDACEALLGAVYIDGGLSAAERAFASFWGEHLDELASEKCQDPKTALQEWSQEKGHGTPRYTDVGQTGPDHAPHFTVSVHIGKFEPVTASGSNKRNAQMEAARAFLNKEKVWTDNV